jgi:hypothetical protein
MNDDNMKQALWSTLESLNKIAEIAQEVSDHNYQDSTTIDLCADIGHEIEFIYKQIVKDEAPEFYREYIEASAQASAEAMHP